MKKLLGPMLYMTDAQSTDTWTFSVNLYLSGTDPTKPPPLRLVFLDTSAQELPGAVITDPKLAADFSALESPMAGVLWKWNVSLPRAPHPTRVAYRFVPMDGAAPLDGVDDVKDVVVPERGTQPRAAFFSCNGGGSAEAWKAVSKMGHPFACWEDMREQHEQATGGFHLLIGGGDQVYADSIWYASQELVDFRKLPLEKKLICELPANFHDDMVARYVELYCERWSGTAGIAPMLARVPGLFTWDDHDIFDGWGSHERLQASPWYRALYSAAALAYEAFQLGGLRTAEKTPRERKPGETHYLRTVRFTGDECDLDVVMLDLRSGRTSRVRSTGKTEHVVMNEAQWSDLDTWRREHQAGAGMKYRHVIVVSSVPLVHLRFGQAAESVAGMMDLRDDMLDQWESIVHRGERTRLIMDLFRLAKESCCAVTVISGDVHVGARGLIRSRNPEHLSPGVAEAAIEQVTSSAIVHPPPGMLEFLGMRTLAGEGVEDLPSFIQTELLPVGADHYLRERNWLSLCVKRPTNATSRPKLWLRWETEHSPLSMQVVVEPPAPSR
ncbi:alkaline phosphatase D family protein [Pyxidicoccus sp. MSG2]|uniref:alkaline phosphatase D family protein n=1 Tax=Pyxidicoccus sp. MSG2 TaxID=2996790 RepID=UPI0022704ACD|nr:alkaline phosphatase D family protein [Pyxidicoccus sp. MSG2]MCY1018232.1 alkaline phosphatase D family protein [Pyxidicoccus sp. MSG2]